MKKLIVSMLALGACVHAPPPQQLIEAREGYLQLGAADPRDVEAARRAMIAARRELDERGLSPRAEDLAYAASRRVDIAAANMRTEQYRRRTAWLESEAAGLKAKVAQAAPPPAEPPPAPPPMVAAAPPPPPPAPAAPAPSTSTTTTTTTTTAAPASEKAEAAPSPAVLRERLTAFAKTTDEARGTVLTIPASLIFAPGKTGLTDTADERLAQVAAFIMTTQEPVSVEVYTDNIGSAPDNRQLSTDRAKTVLDALVTHGVPANRLEAKGRGDANPIADNAKPEGRSTNRRLEIVIHRANKPVS